MNKEGLKYFRPAILIFIFLTAFFITGKSFLVKKGFDQEVLLIGNLFLFFITGVSFWVMANGMKTKNTHGLLRGVYGGIMIKLFGCLILATVYILSARKNVNKLALFTCMFLYIVYTFIEVKGLMKLSSKKADA
jgi:hypothetical protein